MPTRKSNKTHGQLPDDSDSEDLWRADKGWLARWRELHAQSYTEVQEALHHAPTPTPRISLMPPYHKRKFLATVPVFFTDTTNIARHRYYVITESPDKPTLQGV